MWKYIQNISLFVFDGPKQFSSVKEFWKLFGRNTRLNIVSSESLSQHVFISRYTRGGSFIYSSEQKHILYKDYQAKLKFLITKIGLNPEEFSSHSFRRADCSFAFQSSVRSELIQIHSILFYSIP